MPRGAPLDSPELKNIGVSAPLAYQYVKRGWLNKLGRGVFTLPADELQRDATLKFLERQMPGLHVGGKTALAWRGVRHNIPANERLSLWGLEPGKLPSWLSSKFPSRVCFEKAIPQEAAGCVRAKSIAGIAQWATGVRTGTRIARDAK